MTKQLISVVTGKIPADFYESGITLDALLMRIQEGVAQSISDRSGESIPFKACKTCLDPNYAHLKRVTHSTRRCTRSIIVFHYYRFTEPDSCKNLNLRFYDKDTGDFWGLPIDKLIEWLGSPTLYLFDSADAEPLIQAMSVSNPDTIAFGCPARIDRALCVISEGRPRGLFTNCLASPALTLISIITSRFGKDSRKFRVLSQQHLHRFSKVLSAVVECIARDVLDLEISARLFNKDRGLAKVTIAALVCAWITHGDFFSTLPIDWRCAAFHPLWTSVEGLILEFVASEISPDPDRLVLSAIAAFQLDPQPCWLPLLAMSLQSGEEISRSGVLQALTDAIGRCRLTLVAPHLVGLLKSPDLEISQRSMGLSILAALLFEDPGSASSVLPMVDTLQTWLVGQDLEISKYASICLSMLVPEVPADMQSMAKENGMHFAALKTGISGRAEISRSSVIESTRILCTKKTRPKPITLESEIFPLFESENLRGLKVSDGVGLFWDERNNFHLLGKKSHRPRFLGQLRTNFQVVDYSAPRRLIATADDHVVRIFKEDLEISDSIMSECCHGVFFSGDDILLSTDAGGLLSAWDITTMKRLGKIPLSTDITQAASLEPSVTCSAGLDGKISVVDWRQKKLFSMRYGSAIVAMHAEDCRIAIASALGKFEVWDSRNRKQLSMGRFEGSISHCDVHASGSLLFQYCGDSHLGFIDSKTENRSQEFIGLEERVLSLRFASERSICLSDKALYLIEPSCQIVDLIHERNKYF